MGHCDRHDGFHSTAGAFNILLPCKRVLLITSHCNSSRNHSSIRKSFLQTQEYRRGSFVLTNFPTWIAAVGSILWQWSNQVLFPSTTLDWSNIWSVDTKNFEMMDVVIYPQHQLSHSKLSHNCKYPTLHVWVTFCPCLEYCTCTNGTNFWKCDGLWAHKTVRASIWSITIACVLVFPLSNHHVISMSTYVQALPAYMGLDGNYPIGSFQNIAGNKAWYQTRIWPRLQSQPSLE